MVLFARVVLFNALTIVLSNLIINKIEDEISFLSICI